MNPMNTQRANVRRRSAGFSLIEVLMATLILALGLLGLGAVLPVIIRQQSLSSDQSLGTSAMQSAIAHLEGSKSLAAEKWKNFVYAPPLTLIDDWRAQRWFVPTVNREDASVELFDPAVSLTIVPNNIAISGSTESISLGSRVFPTPETGDTEPRFVWDIAMRRDFKGGGMQLAVFVRRIDPFAARGVEGTLFEALLDPRSQTRRFPVSLDNEGRPRLDGAVIAGRYSVPLTAEVELYPDPGATDRRFISVSRVFDSSTGNFINDAIAFPQLSQPGQKLVDNLGNIHTVDSAELVGNVLVLRLTRPIALSVPVQRVPETLPDGVRAEAFVPTQYLQQVVFTPQVPVAVEVINKKFDLAPDAVERILNPTAYENQ